MAVELDATYVVRSSSPVKLTVVIGDAQLGTSLVRLGSQKPLTVGQVKGLAIGKGSSLRGRKLFIKSVVTDVNDKTNHTSISYKLSGGTAPASFGLDATVEEEGDSIVYRATFSFT